MSQDYHKVEGIYNRALLGSPLLEVSLHVHTTTTKLVSMEIPSQWLEEAN
jgi:hypothetical protein